VFAIDKTKSKAINIASKKDKQINNLLLCSVSYCIPPCAKGECTMLCRNAPVLLGPAVLTVLKPFAIYSVKIVEFVIKTKLASASNNLRGHL
jgi:hypothetical protein